MIKTLKKELIQVGTTSSTKDELLQEIAGLVNKSCDNLSQKDIYKALVKREKLSSTGLTGGIAIPHCAFENISEFHVGAIIVKDGIDFDSLDEEPTKIIFFSVGPKDQQNQHITTLTSISKIAKDNELLEQVLSAEKSEQVFKLLHRDSYDNNEKGIKCQFVIHVQDEKLFQDVLELLASDVEGAVSVIDAQTAGYHLHKLPLFSSFWNDISDSFSKIIIAIIDKPLMNETIRRINMIKADKNQGLLVTVNELLYFDGSLEY
ncbi:MAG: PTS sugar transporter subunit IIA [Spirochaetaceae bacterium]